MFMRNCWYVAAWDHEIEDRPLGRILLNEPVVLYRKADGTPVALEDRCVHRQAPLSLGEVVPRADIAAELAWQDSVAAETNVLRARCPRGTLRAMSPSSSSRL